MWTVRTTAMIALVSTLATVGIGAALQRKSGSAAVRAPAVPAPGIAPVASLSPTASAAGADDLEGLAQRRIIMPVQGIDAAKVHDTFNEMRVGHRHEALDIMAPKGTPVVAVDDGSVARLFRSLAGGITIYQFDPSQRFAYYYAHLDRYADDLKEGMPVKRGEVIGYVGSTGNAPAHAPHLHFTIFVLGPQRQWWRGKAVNPLPYLTASR